MKLRYWMSPAQRDVMIAHLNGVAVPIVHASQYGGLQAQDAAARTMTTNSLMGRGFLRPDRGANSQQLTPTHTVITDEGRAALAGALAEWANSIVAAMRSSDTVKDRMSVILVDGAWREILGGTVAKPDQVDAPKSVHRPL